MDISTVIVTDDTVKPEEVYAFVTVEEKVDFAVVIRLSANSTLNLQLAVTALGYVVGGDGGDSGEGVEAALACIQLTTLLKVLSLLPGGACPAVVLVSLCGLVNFAAWTFVMLLEMTLSFVAMNTSEGMLLNGLCALIVFRRPVWVVGR